MPMAVSCVEISLRQWKSWSKAGGGVSKAPAATWGISWLKIEMYLYRDYDFFLKFYAEKLMIVWFGGKT